MRKSALYSRSTSAPAVAPTAPAAQRDAQPAAPDRASGPVPLRLRLRRISFTDPRLLWAAIGLLSLLLVATLSLSLRPGARALTQDAINAAVLHTLENTALPSPAARAAAMIQPSVVRVMGYFARAGTADSKVSFRCAEIQLLKLGTHGLLYSKSLTMVC